MEAKMGFEKEKLKQVRYLILFVAAVVLLIIYSGNVMNGLRLFWVCCLHLSWAARLPLY